MSVADMRMCGKMERGSRGTSCGDLDSVTACRDGDGCESRGCERGNRNPSLAGGDWGRVVVGEIQRCWRPSLCSSHGKGWCDRLAACISKRELDERVAGVVGNGWRDRDFERALLSWLSNGEGFDRIDCSRALCCGFYRLRPVRLQPSRARAARRLGASFRPDQVGPRETQGDGHRQRCDGRRLHPSLRAQ